ncbi:MAG: type II toxin-antitoxin system RelE/ParE family toxin [Pseudomonadota bacterium]
MTKLNLRITAVAAQDLDNLYTEGWTRWGEEKADAYFEGLLARFERICETPKLYAPVDEIRAGYRRSVYESHAIYYRIQDDTVEIHAVIKHQDIGSRL